jgi:hypothetical protein
MNSMDTFNPEQRCRVYDGLNNEMFKWEPEWAAAYRKYATTHDVGVIEFDGMLLDGWSDCKVTG